MSEKIVEIRYKCTHPSCVVKCRDGSVTVYEDYFNELSGACEEKDLFKSPRGVCRLGFTQKFRALSVQDVTDAGESREESVDGASMEKGPIEILMAEHERVLEKIELIEQQIRRRDVDGLWASTAELQNDITIHSFHKEEEALFPALRDLMPLAESLVAIVKEDHREVLSLLSCFRNALIDGDILDGIAKSIIVNLSNHIRKEDLEFFELIKDALDSDTSSRILEGMKKIDETFERVPAGDRLEAQSQSKAEERQAFDEAATLAREAALADAGSGGGCCHG
ncbi:MAG: hemerythrin domain-containing protein [Thermodesulfobacteriota bacterium]